MTTTKTKCLALRVDRDRQQIERAAMRRLAPVASKALRHAGHAVRVGADPVRASDDVILGNARLGLPGMIPTLTRAMVYADLYGRRRTHLDASRPAIELSAAEDEKEHQRKRDKEALALLLLLGLGGAELELLYSQYRPLAENAAGRIAGQAGEAIRRTASAPTRPQFGRNLRYTPGNGTNRIIRPSGEPQVRLFDATPTRRVKDIAEAFESGGLTATNGYGLEREVSKAVVTKYEQGRFTGTPAATEALWGYHYSAILDNRTTELCKALDGTTAPKDDSFWDTFRPPNHWNCRSLVLPVFESSELRTPSVIQPYATEADIARFKQIKRQFLSYQ